MTARPDGLLLLGSGKMTAAGVAPKAARLDRARVSGLPVPKGAVVLDGVDAETGATQLARIFERPLAIRSAFSAEDTMHQSMAGHFHTELWVPPHVGSIRDAIDLVRASGPEDIRRDVLVMEMVDALHGGVAFSEPGWEDDLVNVVAGQGEQLVSGAEAGDRVLLGRLRRWERPTASIPWARRLQKLLRRTRRVEGDEPWDIEWADDGETCWFVQIRPITAPLVRNDVFTLANHREILPDPPSVFMSSVIMSNGRKVRGPGGMLETATSQRGYFEMFDGRPYINQSITTELVRSLGLPSALVNQSLGGDDIDSIAVNPTRIVLSLPMLVRLGLDQGRAVGRARRVAVQFRTSTDGSDTFRGAADAFAQDHLALVEEMGNLVSAMAVPLAILRRLGVLSEHFDDLDTPGTRIMSDLRKFAGLAAKVPGGVEALAAGHCPDDPVVTAAWTRWLEAHGHRGRFESDLSQPRFVEDEPATLRLACALTAVEPDVAGAGPRWKRRLTTPLWLVGRRALVAREQLRADAMQAFLRHRTTLLTLAEAAVVDGRLPDVEAVWNLSVDELARVDCGEVMTSESLSERRKEIAAHASIDAPEVRRRFGTIEAGSEPDGSGVPLYPGVVEGTAWVLLTPSTDLPSGFDPLTTVLVARSVDAGWVPTFGLVAGAAVDIGGDLSHGSIILRELRLPSITNTRGLTARLETGDHVRLDATTGRIEKKR